MVFQLKESYIQQTWNVQVNMMSEVCLKALLSINVSKVALSRNQNSSSITLRPKIANAKKDVELRQHQELVRICI